VELQWVLGQQRRDALERLPGAQRGPRLAEGGVNGIARKQAAGQSGGVHEDVAHVHRPLRLDQRDGVVLADQADLQRPPLGDVAVHRVEQLEQALLVQLHEGHRAIGLVME
jgi:hypothetical protein